ncbi:hypothetical protein D8X55_02755 [Malacoplasma penetrans]|uniref:Uncharacterized protein n=1 Tax=Malacoplasma penetrans (strain HF-2) TaxID=272633 RepID=Q8EV11_MALP2|nr:hypothetical protein [Malacoplasma penetrans]RXY96716.1 hypothetical protein D8X55_02755 [Malacoplasma penetrans]BAC44550.1 conserved hypothetical protein [Malacoplasma penetrans HF-2]
MITKRERINKVISFIKKPSKSFQIIWTALTFALVITSILIAIFLDTKILNSIIYGFTCFFFIYFLYLFFNHYKKYINQFISSKIKNTNTYTKLSNSKLFNHYDRKILSYILSIIYSVIYVLVLITFGIIYSSKYYGIFSAYYLLSICIKILIILGILKFKNREDVQKRIQLISSLLLLLLNIVICLFITLIIFQPNKVQYDNWVIIIFSSLTTIRLITIIVSLKKWKTKEPLKLILKKIRFIELLVTVVILQTTMLAYYGATQSMEILNYTIGFVVFVSIVILVGWILISSIIQYVKFNKNKKDQLLNN